MKYYKLSLSRNRGEVGIKPQSTEGYFGEIQKDFIPWEGLININFELPEPKLEKKANLTSIINVVFIRSTFLVIEDKLFNFLKDFDIGNYQIWKIKSWQKNKLIERYNLFIINDTKQNQYIDFSKSEFLSKKLGDRNNSSVQKPFFVKNYQEYVFEKEKLRKNKLMLLYSKVTLDLSKATEDMFRIVNAPPAGYFVSEKLKTAIEENGFTGMEFTEVNKLDKVEVNY